MKKRHAKSGEHEKNEKSQEKTHLDHNGPNRERFGCSPF